MAKAPDWRHVEGMETQVRVLVVSNLYLTDYCCTTPQNTYIGDTTTRLVGVGREHVNDHLVW